ncbi:MAG: TerC family protein [Candidatus Hydrogenedentes bacterium]|nr:TerC family protein [Candidatus Hydrogenedentota bacterium]
MLELFTMENGAAIVTLTVLEIVLGIDNVVFIAILAGKLPEDKRDNARRIGLFMAMFVRILLLLSLSWIMGLQKPLFEILGQGFSGRDLVLLIGGGFLIAKATHEIHDKLEGSKETLHQPKSASFGSILAQIVALDIVFSLDSVITAVGMVKQNEAHPWHSVLIMITAIMIAVFVMLIFSGGIARFIERHPTTKMLALSFLLMIGLMLAGEGFHQHIEKGYIYSAMAFSIFVELLNLRITKKPAAATETHKG